MSRISIPLVALAMIFSVGTASAATASVEMAAATQRKLGVATQPLTETRHSSVVPAFARVLDPVPLASLDAEVTIAAAAARSSRAEASRTRSLAAADATVSVRVAEAAEAQARSDEARLLLLKRRLGLEWGPGFMTMGEAARSALVTQLAMGQAALVRLDAPMGLTGLKTARLELGPNDWATARILGPARTGDPRLMSTGLIGLVSGPAAIRLGAGLTLPASLPTGSGRVGVLIPRSALIRSGGATLAYVRKDATHFERRGVVGGSAETGGLFVAAGFRPGEPVVVSGAAALFAAQTPARSEED